REEFRRRINNIFISLTALGHASWMTPRIGESRILRAPTDGVTGKIYRGANALRLLTTESADPRWINVADIERSGWNVKAQAMMPTVLVSHAGEWAAQKVCNAADVIGFPEYEQPGEARRDPVLMAKAL